MYGNLGRIGVITLATDTSVHPEIQRLMPAGVHTYPAPILLPRGEVDAQALAEMLETDSLENAASILTWTGAKTILFACTTGSLVHGLGWDKQLVDRVTKASGLSATTTATAVLRAFKALKVTKLAVVTPYIDELNQIEKKFFEDSGFAVKDIVGLGLTTDPEIGDLYPNDALANIEKIFDESCDGIFISCTDWHIVELVPELEAKYGVPVITSNLAGAWAVLREIGYTTPQPENGRLFTV
jgi:maleate isomerase